MSTDCNVPQWSVDRTLIESTVAGVGKSGSEVGGGIISAVT